MTTLLYLGFVIQTSIDLAVIAVLLRVFYNYVRTKLRTTRPSSIAVNTIQEPSSRSVNSCPIMMFVGDRGYVSCDSVLMDLYGRFWVRPDCLVNNASSGVFDTKITREAEDIYTVDFPGNHTVRKSSYIGGNALRIAKVKFCL